MKLNVYGVLQNEETGKNEGLRFFFFKGSNQYFGDVSMSQLEGKYEQEALEIVPVLKVKATRNGFKTADQLKSGLEIKNYDDNVVMVDVLAKLINLRNVQKLRNKYLLMYNELGKVGTLEHGMLLMYNDLPSSVLFSYQLENKRKFFTVPYSYFRENKVLNERMLGYLETKKVKSVIPGQSGMEKVFAMEFEVYHEEDYLYGENRYKPMAKMGTLASSHIRAYLKKCRSVG